MLSTNQPLAATVAQTEAVQRHCDTERLRWLAAESERRNSYIGGVGSDEKRGFDFDPLTDRWTL